MSVSVLTIPKELVRAVVFNNCPHLTHWKPNLMLDLSGRTHIVSGLSVRKMYEKHLFLYIPVPQ